MKFGSPMRIPIDPFGTPDRGFQTARVTSPFGYRSGGFHGALDIGNGRLGDDLIAVADGVVLAVGNLREPWSQPTTKFPSGNYGGLMAVILHAPGVVSIYAHMRIATVTKGQRIKRGDKVGEIGDTGSAAPPPLGGGGHVHFGIQAPAHAVPPGVGSRVTAFGYGLDVDPWPLITGKAELLLEDDMKYPGPNKPMVLATIKPGTNVRYAATLDDSSIAFKAEEEIQVGVFSGVEGEEWVPSTGSKGTMWAWIGYGGECYFVHSALLHNLTVTSNLALPVPPDLSDELSAARAEAARQRARAEKKDIVLDALGKNTAKAVASGRAI